MQAVKWRIRWTKGSRIIYNIGNRKIGGSNAERHRDSAQSAPVARRDGGGEIGILARRGGVLRQIQSESAFDRRRKTRQADTCDRDESDAARRGQDYGKHKSCRRAKQARQKRGSRAPRAFAGTRFRDKRRRMRRRIRSDNTDGRNKFAFYGRFPRDNFGEQSSFRAYRQSHTFRERVRDKRSYMAALPRLERQGAARSGSGARRKRKRSTEERRVHDNGGFRNNGDTVPCRLARRPQETHRQRDDRVRRKGQGHTCPRSTRRGVDDGTAKGGA